MMDLFSSFNPISSKTLSLNWIMIIIPIIAMMNSYWVIDSMLMKTINLLTLNISNQFKHSSNKTNLPNMNTIMSIMMMIFHYNIMSLLPNTFSMTSHLMMNLSMALILWMTTTMKKSNNTMNMMTHLTPSNTPPPLIPFMVMIELISLLIQPMTLAIRLTANIMAGHITMIMISQMYHLTIIPTLIMNSMMMTLEMGISLIQAYVFSMLITMYSK